MDPLSFCGILARSIHRSSIEVSFSIVRALHIEEGFQDPLLNYLRLQRLIRGMKRMHDSTSSSRLPITNDLMLVIWKSLDLNISDHSMFWAACTLGYFGFLRASESTVPSMNNFSIALHITAQDVAVDCLSSPSCMRVRIKASKTDPFARVQISTLA